MATKSRKRKAANNQAAPVSTPIVQEEVVLTELQGTEEQQLIAEYFKKYNDQVVVKKYVGTTMVVFDLNGKEIHISRKNGRTKITQIVNGVEELIYMEVMTKYNVDDSIKAAKAALALKGI